MVQKKSLQDRLKEIADATFGELSDEEVLRLLAERSRLAEQEKEFELQQKKNAHLEAVSAEKTQLEAKLSELNKLISPEKPDDELLHLIKERKEIEATLDTVNAELEMEKRGGAPAETSAETPEKKGEEKPVPEAAVSEPLQQEEVEVLEKEVTETEEFGREKIVETELSETSDLRKYIDRMKNNPSQLGTILDQLPASAKKDKVFMLEVAKIDPAYAMHYADATTLKKEEDFNIRVAGMKNERNTGNALAEMLPEARTSKVVLSAVKRDYMNVRFVLPQMDDYDEILDIAKKGTLEAVRKLKDGADIRLLVPRPLQKDQIFMEQVEKIAGKA